MCGGARVCGLGTAGATGTFSVAPVGFRPSQEVFAVSFRSVFVAVVIGTALLVGAFMINWYRPRIVTEQPTADLIRASGKCAECHANL